MKTEARTPTRWLHAAGAVRVATRTDPVLGVQSGLTTTPLTLRQDGWARPLDLPLAAEPAPQHLPRGCRAGPQGLPVAQQWRQAGLREEKPMGLTPCSWSMGTRTSGGFH